LRNRNASVLNASRDPRAQKYDMGGSRRDAIPYGVDNGHNLPSTSPFHIHGKDQAAGDISHFEIPSDKQDQ
jgi:hypothetical protein